MGSAEGSDEPEEARSLFCRSIHGFEDVNALVISDPEHTEDEERGYHPRIQPAGKSARRLSLLQSI